MPAKLPAAADGRSCSHPRTAFRRNNKPPGGFRRSSGATRPRPWKKRPGVARWIAATVIPPSQHPHILSNLFFFPTPDPAGPPRAAATGLQPIIRSAPDFPLLVVDIGTQCSPFRQPATAAAAPVRRDGRGTGCRLYVPLIASGYLAGRDHHWYFLDSDASTDPPQKCLFLSPAPRHIRSCCHA